MSNKHFCDVGPDDMPGCIPRTTKLKDGNPATLTGAWSYPAAGDRPALLKVRYDGCATADGTKPHKSMAWSRLCAADIWETRLAGHEPPLYGLEHICPDVPCFVVEGEKAAAALRTLGLNAVGMPGTSAAKSVDLSPLDGLDVVLWPDNDKAGADAMDTIAVRLARAHRRIAPDALDLPKKGDAADLVATGDIADAVALWERLTPAMVDVSGPVPLLETLPVNWQALGAPERTFVFSGGRVPAECVTLLSAAGGTGKSMMLLTLAVSAAIGKELLADWAPIRPGRVVMVSVEDDMAEITRRLLRLFKGFDLDGNDAELVQKNISFLCRETFSAVSLNAHTSDVKASDDLNALAAELAENPPVLVTIDPLSAILSGLDENDNPTAQLVVGVLRTAVPAGTGMLLATHTSKAERATGGSARGAGGWSDAARQAWSLRPLEKAESAKIDGNAARYGCLQCLKSNYGPMHSNAYLGRSDLPGAGGVLMSVDWAAMGLADAAKNRDALTMAVLQVLVDFEPVTKAEILSRASSPDGTKRGGHFRDLVADIIGGKATTAALEPVLTELMTSGRVVTDGKPGQKKPLRLSTLRELN